MRHRTALLSLVMATLASAFLLADCTRSFELSVEPPDAALTIDKEPAQPGKAYTAAADTISVTARKTGYEDVVGTFSVPCALTRETIAIRLQKKKFAIRVKVTEGRAACEIDGEGRGETPCAVTLEYGTHRLVLRRKGLPDLEAVIEARRAGDYLYRMQAAAPPITPLGVFSCGPQPKQVLFSPDNRFLYLPLLDGEGFQIFSLETLSPLASVKAGPKPALKGFPEGLFIPQYQAFLVSQMSTNAIHEFAYAADGAVTYRRTFPSGGGFPKFMAYCPSLDLVAVSNWLANDVALIDYATGKIVRKITGLATPRGVQFSADGSILYIASYDGGNVFRYATADWKETHRFFRAGSCMRHIALAPDGKRLFVSDMSRYVVYELGADDLALIHTYKASWNTNTIGLDSRGRFLFVSNRGPNNKIDYTLRSPEDGKVLVYDTEKKTLVATLQGGNQPTGLAVSGDDRYLVFTNFLDRNFEIYDISRLEATP
jgi:hypothetical protein